MKFSTAAAASSILALASARFHTQTVAVVCTDPAPSTVTQTVTVTAAPGEPVAPTPPPFVTTENGVVTSCDYDGKASTVYVYPTGTGNHDTTIAIYHGVTIISVVVVNIDVTVINGTPSTVTVTKSEKPTYTPPPPPPPAPTGNATTGISASSTSSSAGSKATWNVDVAGPNLLKYTPPYVNAAVGDIILFNFLQANHTLTQSSLNTPCAANGGFDTGFNQANPNNINGLKVVAFEVKESKPLWFYCRQSTHCGKGMVFAINPAGKFDQFLANALAVGNSTLPAKRAVKARTWVS